MDMAEPESEENDEYQDGIDNTIVNAELNALLDPDSDNENQQTNLDMTNTSKIITHNRKQREYWKQKKTNKKPQKTPQKQETNKRTWLLLENERKKTDWSRKSQNIT